MHAREYPHARSVVPDHGGGLPRAMRPGGAFRVSRQGLCVWVEAGCATFGDVVGVLNAGVSVTLRKGIGVAGTDMAAP